MPQPTTYHTPAPWIIDSQSAECIISQSKGQAVCSLFPYGEHEERANTQLILAAPAMLQDLQELRVFVDGHLKYHLHRPFLLKAIDATIEKALYIPDLMAEKIEKTENKKAET